MNKTLITPREITLSVSVSGQSSTGDHPMSYYNQPLEIKGDGYTLLRRVRWDGDVVCWTSPNWHVRLFFGRRHLQLSTRSPHLASAHQFAALLIAECQRCAAAGRDRLTLANGREIVFRKPKNQSAETVQFADNNERK